MYLCTYGTLRVGQWNWEWSLKNCPHIGTYRVKGFLMYSNGAFPYAAEGEGEITVDVFRIGKSELGICDQIEGYPHHYDRKEVHIDELDLDAWIYYITSGQKMNFYTMVENGDWLTHQDSVGFDL